MAIQLRAANRGAIWLFMLHKGAWVRVTGPKPRRAADRYGLWASLHVAETKGFPADSPTAKAEFAKN
ncbi:MAG: hypothetical protein CMJ50_07135 [Planctomycetaceae bacterium]|nr:hypothetical protein [Planctomycetaceae bacterium]